jgi:hypothetical protein
MDIGEANFAFHTDKEQNLWWELTLDKSRFVEYIILHNRSFDIYGLSLESKFFIFVIMFHLTICSF